MGKYRVKVECEYEVECDDEDEVLNQLEEDLDNENTTAEVEFWDNCEITEIKNRRKK